MNTSRARQVDSIIPLTVVVVAGWYSSAGFAQGSRGQTAAAGRVTFSETIAPSSTPTASCHRPGEPRPSLSHATM